MSTPSPVNPAVPAASEATSPTTVTALSPGTLRHWVAEHEDLVVIDVRSAAEFESLHIHGSYNVPLPLLSEHADELAARLGSRVVLACQSGVRAEQARQKLAASGIDTAHVLTGGVPGYAAVGGDVVRGGGRWDLERQVRMAAGSLVIVGLAGGRFVSPKIRALAGVIGTGLTFSAATNTCAMGRALSAMPWNRAAQEPTRESVILSLPTAGAGAADADADQQSDAA
ncbi:rhodanese-related sulfurtransferase [Arthrobacter sp. CAN_A2]|uniref:rhodanese-like domain-containing protein n=1 Tax=Arthrobacter sp. CAN_A2 TaxID=2787718 RepID=UPI0018EFD086